MFPGQWRAVKPRAFHREIEGFFLFVHTLPVFVPESLRNVGPRLRRCWLRHRLKVEPRLAPVLALLLPGSASVLSQASYPASPTSALTKSIRVASAHPMMQVPLMDHHHALCRLVDCPLRALDALFRYGSDYPASSLRRQQMRIAVKPKHRGTIRGSFRGTRCSGSSIPWMRRSIFVTPFRNASPSLLSVVVGHEIEGDGSDSYLPREDPRLQAQSRLQLRWPPGRMC